MGPDRRTLDYATPAETKRQPYWLIFFPAWVLSLPVANILDHAIKMHLTGRGADGGVTLLSMFAILPAVIIAALARRRWWIAAAIGGLCSPLAVLAMYCLALLAS